MSTAWFCFLAAMVAMYVVLDGFDLGVGALHLLVARNEDDREQATAAIGPVWNGNEVWLIAGGGVLFLAFPAAYAAAFSGLYYAIAVLTDSVYRAEFLSELEGTMRETFRARAEYLRARRSLRTAAASCRGLSSAWRSASSCHASG